VPPGAPDAWSVPEHPALLVPLDGSAVADQALDTAVPLARALGAALHLLRVVEPIHYAAYYDAPVLVRRTPDIEVAQAERHLQALAERLMAAGHAVTTQVVVGQPAAQIVEVARERGAVLTVLATHGRGGLARFVMGSVATDVLRHAAGPLLLVRPPAAGSAETSIDVPKNLVTLDEPRAGPAVTPAPAASGVTLTAAEAAELRTLLAEMAEAHARQGERLAAIRARLARPEG
jgi:nucleotide-binding universal stress UspA family protein